MEGQQGMQFGDAMKYESMLLRQSESESESKRRLIIMELVCLVFENLPKLGFNVFLFHRFMLVTQDAQFAEDLAGPIFFAILSEVRAVFRWVDYVVCVL